MLNVLFACIAGLPAAACGAVAFSCSDDDACGVAGTCEPTGYCSFPDSACSSGRRYGRHAIAEYANTCVHESDTDGPHSSSETGTTLETPTDSELSAVTTVGSGDTTTSATSGADGTTETSAATSSSTTGETGAGSTTAPASCDDKYGEVAGYALCWETATACAFNANTAGGDCNMLCGEFGGTCEAAYDNSESECVIERPNQDECTTPRADEICECSK